MKYYYYSKLNYTENLFTEPNTNRLEVLQMALEKDIFIHARGSNFKFLRIEKITIDDKVFLSGALIKYQDVDEKSVEHQIVKDVRVPNKIIAEVKFFIEFEHNYLFYDEVAAHINHKAFIGYFNSLMDKCLADENMNVTLYPVTDKYSFFDRLKAMKTIKSLEFTIRPTNPSADELIREMDEHLKAQNVQKKKITYKAKPTGLVLDQEIKNTTVIVDVGYGKGVATGIDAAGNTVRISSMRSEKQKFTPKIDYSSPQDILNEITKLI